jgi:polyribonucleotide nucleotidyltransferase
VKGLRNEVQVVITVLSLNPAYAYDVLAINAASVSTQLSGLPFSGPIGGTRVALIEGQWVAFPTYQELERATFDMVVAGRVLDSGEVAIMMVEAEATENAIELIAGGATRPTEEVVAAGLEAAKPFIAELCRAQAELAKVAAKATVEYPVFLDYEDDVFAAVSAEVAEPLALALTIADKQDREAELDRIKELTRELVAPQFPERTSEIGPAFRALTKKLVRRRILRTRSASTGAGSRYPDPVGRGRRRAPDSRVGAVRAAARRDPRRHDAEHAGAEQRLDTLSPQRTKRYMHNYNFQPYSTGETGRVGSPKRREIGHGALAERALVPVLPSREEFLYAIRQVSEALGSNGSTSMGSVCASTLSLLNAGVPLKAPVAGIAMGLVSDSVDGATEYDALTDILGAEDAFGDMDFKVARRTLSLPCS